MLNIYCQNLSDNIFHSVSLSNEHNNKSSHIASFISYVRSSYILLTKCIYF